MTSGINTLPSITTPKIGEEITTQVVENTKESSKLILLDHDSIGAYFIVETICHILGYDEQKAVQIMKQAENTGEAELANGDYDKMVNLAMDFASNRYHGFTPYGYTPKSGIAIPVRVDE